MTRWTKKQPSAAEKRHETKAQADRNCQHGKHTLTNTFRPGERLCMNCSILFYCPECLKRSNLKPVGRARVYPVACAIHTQVEVRA